MQLHRSIWSISSRKIIKIIFLGFRAVCLLGASILYMYGRTFMTGTQQQTKKRSKEGCFAGLTIACYSKLLPYCVLYASMEGWVILEMTGSWYT